MNRIVSFGLLLTVILITGFVFFKVMAGFFLPLFMAALLVVLFHPLHVWILEKVRGREKLAALLATAVILLIVLVPFTILLFSAANESRSVIRKLDPTTIDDKIRKVRTKLGLDMPAPQDFDTMDRVVEAIGNQSIAQNIELQREQIDYDITELRGLSIDLGTALNEQGIPLQWNETLAVDGQDEPAPAETPSAIQAAWTEYAQGLASARQMLARDLWESLPDVDTRQKQLSDARRQFNESVDQFYRFKFQVLGGPVRAWLKEFANPEPAEQKAYIEKVASWLRGKMVSFGSATTSFLARFLLGVAIMALALFSFFLDGPAMLKALKQMTPLDDEHENELIGEFEKVSRAVVMATLLSALVQGLLSGIGYYFAGMDAVVLLMLLTGVLALVPFVGAAAVWVPCSLWLIFVDGQLTAGVLLAIYGTVVVSMADNVIKPFILHGQSNLHPLWALLSVLGGVAALGPIGILIGPMVVVFLQTLLKILQREIAAMDQPAGLPAAATAAPPDPSQHPKQGPTARQSRSDRRS